MKFLKLCEDTWNLTNLLRQRGVKIKAEIPRKRGIELVFYEVADAILSKNILREYRTELQDTSLFIYF